MLKINHKQNINRNSQLLNQILKTKNIIFLILFFLQIEPVQAKLVKYDKEQELKTKNSTFKISSGWSYDDEYFKIVSPEGDLTAYLLETPLESNIDELSLKLWQKVDPTFNLKISQKVNPPSKDGWEKTFQIIYETPLKDNNVVLSSIRIFKNTAYCFLLKASNSGLSKRAAQLQIVGDTWHPKEFQKEDLSQITPKKFDTSETVALDKFIQKAMADLSIPGASIAVIQNNKVIYRKGFGVKKQGSRELVTPETLFMIGSTTKPLTTLMLSKLDEEKKLSWNTPINKILPDFKLADSSITDKVLVEHTACACTGMPRRDMEFVLGSLTNSLEDTLKQLQTFKPTTGFGETFQYSNHLVAVGGMVGGQVYNKGTTLFDKYENAMSDLVFKPLEMTNTVVKLSSSKLSNFATPHSRDLKGIMASFPQEIDDMVYAIAPAGSIWSNVDDLSKYVLMELNDGQTVQGKRLFSRDEIIKRRTSRVKVDENTTYGLGLFIEHYKGLEIIGHSGNTMGFTHDLFFLPKYNIGMIIQANAGSVNGFRNSLRQKLIELLFSAKPKSDELLSFSKEFYKKMAQEAKLKISLKPKDVKWLQKTIGTYENADLGKIKIIKNKNRFYIESARLKSQVGTYQEKSGEKMMTMTDAPWSGGLPFRVTNDKKPKIVYIDDQAQYEFTRID